MAQRELRQPSGSSSSGSDLNGFVIPELTRSKLRATHAIPVILFVFPLVRKMSNPLVHPRSRNSNPKAANQAPLRCSRTSFCGGGYRRAAREPEPHAEPAKEEEREEIREERTREG